MRLSTTGTHLTALLVDRGPDTRVDYLNDSGVKTLSSSTCWGEDDGTDDGCYYEVGRITKNVTYEIVSRGFLDTRNNTSLTTDASVAPGTWQTFTWLLMPTDHVFKAGHTLQLIIAASDPDWTVVDTTAATITIDPGTA